MIVVPITTVLQIDALHEEKPVLMISTPRICRQQLRHLAVVQFLVVVIAVLIQSSSRLAADDWPQINGPDRNGIATGEKLMSGWPDTGLQEVWSHPVGQGFSGPVVVGETLVVFHRPGKKYLVEALNAKTGKLIWNQELVADYRGGGPDGDLGPKSVPLIHAEHVYLLGTGGNLFCLKLADGEIVWQKNVLSEYKSPTGYFGAGSSPIVVGSKLLLNVGGRDAAVVAFDLETGAEMWKSFDDRASYSSPIEIKTETGSLVVFITRLHLIGLQPDTGKVLFDQPFGKTGATVNGAMPVHIDNHVFVNSAYNVGAQWIKITGNEAKKIWGNDESFSSQYSTPVFAKGMLYGTAGREDFDNGSYRCVDPTSGKVLWKRNGFPVGHSLLVGSRIVVLDSDGGFHVIEADSSKFKRVYETKLFDSKSRAMPAISDGLFYARSNAVRGKGELVCVRIGPTE